jgi:RimJ/RimL family protein N-acetyltransferase
MQLVRPGPEQLSGYVAALERGWSADNERCEEATREELARIGADAKGGLGLMLAEVRAVGLPYLEITTDPDNIASQRVIAANGGVLVERFTKPPQFGSKPGLRFRIALHEGA